MALVATAKQFRASQCRVRTFSISLDSSAIRGVERIDQITPVADQWPQVGTLSARTGDIPVFSLAGLLGLPEADTDGSQLLLLDTPNGPIGVQVNHSSQGSVVAPADFVRMPAVVRSPNFSGVVRTENALLPWLDLDSIFTGQPRDVPAALAWRHQVSATAKNRLMVIPLTGSPGERAWTVGLPAAAVAELVEANSVIAVPGTPKFVAGVMSWQNRVIGVMDLFAWLGLQPLETAKSLIAVVASPGSPEPIGLLVPRGVRLLKLPIPNQASERTFPGDAERIVMPVEVGDQTIALVDLAHLLK